MSFRHLSPSATFFLLSTDIISGKRRKKKIFTVIWMQEIAFLKDVGKRPQRQMLPFVRSSRTQVYIIALGYCLLYHSGGKQTFSHLSPTTTPSISGWEQGCVQLCGRLNLPPCNLRGMDQWGHDVYRDHKSKGGGGVGGVGQLRYGSTLTWRVPNKCQRGYWDRETPT